MGKEIKLECNEKLKKELLDDFFLLEKEEFLEKHREITESDYENKRKMLEFPVICEQLGWSLSFGKHESKYYCEITQHSPAGEDFGFTVWFDGTRESFRKEVEDYYEGFDVEEHAKMWIGGRGAPGIVELVNDAKEIDQMLKELSDALDRGYVETGESSEDSVANREYWERMMTEMRTAVERIADYSDPKIDRYVLADHKEEITKSALDFVIGKLENLCGHFPTVDESEEE